MLFSEDEFVRFARAAVVEACAEFAADQYFTQRAAITAKMSEALKTSLKRRDVGLVRAYIPRPCLQRLFFERLFCSIETQKPEILGLHFWEISTNMDLSFLISPPYHLYSGRCRRVPRR